MKAQTSPDVVLVGAGVMSATLGMLLKQLNPGTTLEVFESLFQAFELSPHPDAGSLSREGPRARSAFFTFQVGRSPVVR
jgi:hypothetical protein